MHCIIFIGNKKCNDLLKFVTKKYKLIVSGNDKKNTKNLLKLRQWQVAARDQDCESQRLKEIKALYKL